MTRIVLLVDHSDVVNSSECLDRIVSETVTDISSLLRNYCDETKRAIGTRHSDIVEVPAHAMLATPTGLRALFTVRSKWGTHDELVELSYDECAVRVSPGAGGAPPVVEFRFEPTVCVYEVRGFRCSDDRIALDVTAHYRTPAIDAPDTSADDEECEPEMSEGVAEEEITQKVGTPYFYGADGMKFMSLFVDIGLSFSPNEITVQILKDNIIQVSEKSHANFIKRKIYLCTQFSFLKSKYLLISSMIF